jgi:hypothetical protein
MRVRRRHLSLPQQCRAQRHAPRHAACGARLRRVEDRGAIREGARDHRASGLDRVSGEETTMKTSCVWTAALVAALQLATQSAPVSAQPVAPEAPVMAGAVSVDAAGVSPTGEPGTLREPPVRFEQIDLSGPRIGVMLAAGGPGIEDRLKSHHVGRVISQFGWQFERQISPLGGGPQLVTECIPLFGGVEYGTLIPSVTLALGVRLPSGIEFGMGPSLTMVSSTGRTNAGLVIALGKTLDYSGVNIPLNLALSTNPKGTMVTLIAGYAIRRTPR